MVRLMPPRARHSSGSTTLLTLAHLSSHTVTLNFKLPSSSTEHMMKAPLCCIDVTHPHSHTHMHTCMCCCENWGTSRMCCGVGSSLGPACINKVTPVKRLCRCAHWKRSHRQTVDLCKMSITGLFFPFNSKNDCREWLLDAQSSIPFIHSLRI